MIAKINSASNLGLNIFSVVIEVDIRRGMPDFRIVGLPDAAVRESKERVKSAIENSGYKFPLSRIIVNLAPADLKKEGPAFDLPIAIGILCASKQLKKFKAEDYIVLGELGLGGDLRPIKGMLPIALEFYKLRYKFVIPAENTKEVSLTGLECAKFNDLKSIVEYFNVGLKVEIETRAELDEYIERRDYKNDFKYIKGQRTAKRAISIAVAGGHNILIKGSPGTGKTMLAKAIPSIMPNLDIDEALEITKIYSVAGLLKQSEPIITKHPFRQPHHSASPVSIIGGGSIPKPGEVSLSHLGVLFLDEIPEFKRNVLESLREPLEEGNVTISRVNATITFPSDFILVASMNPCPCGNFGNPKLECRCSEYEINRYNNRLSGPLMDRIDIVVFAEPVDYGDLSNSKIEEASESIKNKVSSARKIQKERFAYGNIRLNSKMNKEEVKEFCKIDNDSRKLLERAYKNLNLSVRAYDKILKVSRTIADLEGRKDIELNDLAEAIHYRM